MGILAHTEGRLMRIFTFHYWEITVPISVLIALCVAYLAGFPSFIAFAAAALAFVSCICASFGLAWPQDIPYDNKGKQFLALAFIFGVLAAVVVVFTRQ